MKYYTHNGKRAYIEEYDDTYALYIGDCIISTASSKGILWKQLIDKINSGTLIRVRSDNDLP